MLKIGIMAPPWLPVPPPAYGGTEGVIDRLARGLRAAGHDVLLWTVAESTCSVPRAWVRSQAAPHDMGNGAIEMMHIIEGYAAMREWGADIVHDHTLVGPLYACSFPDMQVVTTAHGPFNDEISVLYRTISPTVPVVCISHDQAQRGSQYIRPAAVIHHGLDPDEMTFGRGEGDDQGPYLLNLSRMNPSKGIREAILAARAAGQRLLIASKMREAAEVEYFHAQVEPLLDDRIVYLGEVGVEDRARLLANASALLNPIAWPEPFGLVMIEALWSGTPVIATPCGAAPELIDHGVTGFIETDHDGVVKAIKSLDRLSRAACRASAMAHFSTEKMVAAHLELFSELLETERAA